MTKISDSFTCIAALTRILTDAIDKLYFQFLKQVNIDTIAILLDYVIEKIDDNESIWSAVYGLFQEVSTLPQSQSISLSTLNRLFFYNLHND